MRQRAGVPLPARCTAAIAPAWSPLVRSTQQPEAVALLSDDPVVLLQLVINADDPISPDRVGEALDGKSLLFLVKIVSLIGEHVS